jgi:hypothetical protein
MPKEWRFVHRQDGSIEIHTKQSQNKQSLINVLMLVCLALVAWPHGANFIHELTNGNVVALFEAGCLIALPIAISYVFYSEKWIIGFGSMTIQKQLFGMQKVRHYRSGYFEVVSKKHESGHTWSLKVCSQSGGQELFSPHSIAELDDVARFLSQQTGWPLHEYQGP